MISSVTGKIGSGKKVRPAPITFYPLWDLNPSTLDKRIYNLGPTEANYDNLNARAKLGEVDGYTLKRITGGFDYERTGTPGDIANNLHHNWLRLSVPVEVPTWANEFQITFDYDWDFDYVSNSWQQVELMLGTSEFAADIPKITGPHGSLMYWYTGYEDQSTPSVASGSRTDMTGSATAYQGTTVYFSLLWLPRDRSGYTFQFAIKNLKVIMS